MQDYPYKKGEVVMIPAVIVGIDQGEANPWVHLEVGGASVSVRGSTLPAKLEELPEPIAIDMATGEEKPAKKSRKAKAEEAAEAAPAPEETTQTSTESQAADQASSG